MNLDAKITQLKELADNIFQVNNHEDIAAPLRAPLSSIHSAYYRSQLFSIHNHINPLVSAAAPLISTATALKQLATPPDTLQLYRDLCHEMKAFENKAQGHQYRPHLLLAARYVLCAFIDETILSTQWGNRSEWHSQNLLNTFQREPWGGERFFVILERSCEDPSTHIDLLELMYLCLSLGFEGKYQHIDHPQHKISEIIDDLYEIIQQQRGETNRKLFLQTATAATLKTKKSGLMPLWLISIATVLLLIGVYLGFNYLLAHDAMNFYQLLKAEN